MLCGEFDPNPVAIINPDTAHEPIAGFPEICVGIFSKVIVDELVEKYGGEVIHYGKFCTGPVPIYRVEAFGVEAALFLPHVGAPAAAGFMEDIWAYGGRHFVYCGAAGALRRDIAHGHLIVPTAAIRDEGLSYHYLPPADEIGLKPLCVQAARDAMESLHYPYIEGKTWTTDAFFRETEKKAQRRREQGCVCVEMECAGLAAVAEFRGVGFAEFFYITDTLDGPEWDEGILSQGGAGLADICFSAAVETGKRMAAWG